MDDKRTLVDSVSISNSFDTSAAASSPPPNIITTGDTAVNVIAVGASNLSSVTSAPGTPSPSTSTRAEQTLRAKDLLPLRVFASICIAVFPPTGVAALYYALRPGDECGRSYAPASVVLSAGPGVGAYDAALLSDGSRHAHAAVERLLVFSLALGLVFYVFVVGVVEGRLHNVEDMPVVNHSVN